MHVGGWVKLREVLPSEGKPPRQGCFFPSSPSRLWQSCATQTHCYGRKEEVFHGEHKVKQS